ncbi:MAG: YfcC family protein [Pseudomonadota bacterium]
MSDIASNARRDPDATAPTARDLADRFPSAFTILFALILLMGALTWVLPAGEYARAPNEALGKDAPVPGTYHAVEAEPQGLVDALMAPIAGFYDPASYAANAIDVSLFVLVIGGFLGVVNRTGAIDTGIAAAMARMRGRERWMIPILMTLFAIGGTTYGMAEETLAFYALLIPVVIAAGYDAVTAVAIILIGAGIGVLGSTINPFATTIASNAAGVTFADGIWLRLLLLIGGLAICILYVMRYAARVRADPSLSVVADRRAENEAHFLKGTDGSKPNLTRKQGLVLVLFGLTFAVMIWGVSSQGWWMAEMSALFLGAALVIGIVGWLGEKRFVAAFVDGARDLLGVALIIGLARGIVVIMEAGKISDTILHASEQAIAGYSDIVFINGMFGIEVLLSFLVPSSSGLAVLSMPILAPLADFAGVGRDLTVTAYQSASGLVNLITPTSAVVVGALAIGRVPYDRWLRFVAPLLLILTVFVMAVLSLGALL